MNESVKESFEKSKNVLEEKRKIFKWKICIKKTHTFTLIAMNCVQEQLKNSQMEEKRLKRFSICAGRSKTSFEVKKSFTERSAWSIGFSRLERNLFIRKAFLTFAFRSESRMNKTTSFKKRPLENQYSSSSRKKPRDGQ